MREPAVKRSISSLHLPKRKGDSTKFILKLQLDIDVIPPANIKSLRLSLTNVILDIDISHLCDLVTLAFDLRNSISS